MLADGLLMAPGLYMLYLPPLCGRIWTTSSPSEQEYHKAGIWSLVTCNSTH